MVKSGEGVEYEGYFSGFKPGSEAIRLKYPSILRKVSRVLTQYPSLKGGEPFLERLPCEEDSLYVEKYSLFTIKDIFERAEKFSKKETESSKREGEFGGIAG